MRPLRPVKKNEKSFPFLLLPFVTTIPLILLTGNNLHITTIHRFLCLFCNNLFFFSQIRKLIVPDLPQAHGALRRRNTRCATLSAAVSSICCVYPFPVTRRAGAEIAALLISCAWYTSGNC
jgi:hypothetical protein